MFSPFCCVVRVAGIYEDKGRSLPTGSIGLESSIMRFIFLCMLGFFSCSLSKSISVSFAATAENRVAILVNGDVVTRHELLQRLHLAAVSSGLEPSVENLKFLQPNVVQAMINELLQLQVAKQFNFALTPKQVKVGIEDLERVNGMKPGQIQQFLSQHRIPLFILEQQVKANLVWGDYVRALFQASVRIPDEKINQTLRCYQVNQQQPRHHLGEIVFYVDHPKDDKRVHEQIVKLAQLLQQGASFPGVAYRFSQSPSAQQGGDMGWVLAKDLNPVLQEALQSTKTGQFSGPWRTSYGYVLLAVIEKASPPSGGANRPFSKDQVEQKLRGERLELLARAELKRLRNRAVIEIRNLPF